MLKWITRIIGSLIAAIVVMVVIMVGVIAWDVNFGISGTDFTNVTYEAEDGTTLNAYLAIPEGEGTFPAVLMVHEWWGLNGEIIELADELAAEGYVVLAPDTYRGPTAAWVPGALYLRLNVDMERVDSDMLIAYDYLLSLPETDENIGVVGFCYGGDIAFNHAIANPEIDAVINLYGSTRSDSENFGALLDDNTPSLLGIFGEVDQGIPLDEVSAHEMALEELGLDSTVTIYDDMGHAFVQPDAIEEAGAAQEAWEEILSFLDTHLRS